MIRLIGYLFGVGTVLALVIAAAVAIYIADIAKDLPDYEVLASYAPPVTTKVHASNGELMGEFARERRLFLPIQAMPNLVKAAFISSEDKNFYKHPGLDYEGLARAVITNVQNIGKNRRFVGASTITQQVAKNFLLSSDQTFDRKIREAVLAFRIEEAYSKDRILELYLNEIFFGLGAYGIAGASLRYFDKSVNELQVHEVAYLAGIIKAPNNYHPFRKTEAAINRRNYVIGRLQANGYITVEEADEARSKPLGVTPRDTGTKLTYADYFTEDVRRAIISKYGEDALYEGGLSVRTTIDPDLQRIAVDTMRGALRRFDRKSGYRGPVTKIEDLGDDWGVPLAKINRLRDVPEWQLGVVLDVNDKGATIGLQPDSNIAGKVREERETGTINVEDMKWAFRTFDENKNSIRVKSPTAILAYGDVVYVSRKGDTNLRLEQLPEIAGGMIAMDPHTGRVLAMVGGFSFSASEFNRASQARRQPGSSFKPFVYAAALDNGYTPASVILDAPIKVDQGGDLGIWEPKNYAGGYAGPSTLRLGIEKSRNLMTIRLAKDMGMPLVAEYSERFGIYDDMLPVLSASLGSNETTVLRMSGAYSIMANGGKQVEPSLIDRVQDRYGKTIFKHDTRGCPECNATSWRGQAEPELIDNRDQVLDPMTAYQITSMMEGVVQNGTAPKVKALGRPVAGKTGTTNDEKDAWFMGYTPDLVAGVYIGYDTPRPMGKGNSGGGLASPIFTEFMQRALEDKQLVDFRVPNGMNLIPVSRKTGMQVASANDKGAVLEAFKPGTGPADTYSVIGGVETAATTVKQQVKISPKAVEALNSGGGGLY